MKGRFRKGKKAYKLGRRNRLSGRYILYLNKLERQRKQALRMAQVAMVVANGAVALSQINQMMLPKYPKAILMAQSAIDTQQAISKLLNETI